MPRFLCNLYSVLCTLIQPPHLSTFAQELRSDLHLCTVSLPSSALYSVLHFIPRTFTSRAFFHATLGRLVFTPSFTIVA